MQVDKLNKSKILTFIENIRNNLLKQCVVSVASEPVLKHSDEDREYINHLNVDTIFRDDLTQPSSNFDVVLPTQLDKVTKLQLSSIEFPSTFYMISPSLGNNYFVLKFIDDTNTMTHTTICTIPQGNYTQTSFIIALNNRNNYKYILNSSDEESNLLDELFSTDIFSIDVDGEGSGTGKILFNYNSTSINNVQLCFDTNVHGQMSNIDLHKKIGWIMGFRKNNYSLLKNTDDDFVVNSEGLVNISGPKYIYFVVNDYNANQFTSSFISAFNSLTLNKNILARVPLTSTNFGFEVINIMNVVSTPREYANPITINKLSIQIMDEFGRILDLNNMNVSFCLSIFSKYSKPI